MVSITTLFLLSMSSITGLIQVVKADGAPIYINADGSISPSTAPIYSADNITYTLTGNIAANGNGIVIKRYNIVLNGAGYTVTGNGSAAAGSGIMLRTVGNVTINDMRITNFGYGIGIESSSNNSVSRNNMTNNFDGIVVLSSSDNNTLSGNNVTNNSYGIYLISSSDNNTLSGNNVSNNGYGIYLSNSSNNTLSGNNFTANSNYGIVLYSASDNNTLSGNNVTNSNNVGIWLEYSSNCTVYGNNVTANNGYGIVLGNSYNNALYGNNVTANNVDGIWLDSSSDNNALSGNNVTANSNDGIYLISSSNNTIYHNDFNNNTSQVSSYNSTNVWDNGSVGNYWSDYLTKYPNATFVDSSGVWNTPYVIDANNTDYYPLTVQYVIPEFPSFLILPLFLIATILTVIIYKKKGVKTSQS